MEQVVVLMPYKICDLLLNSSRNQFGLHQEKKCQSDHEVRGPKRHILRPTLSIKFCDGRGNIGALVKKRARAHGKEML